MSDYRSTTVIDTSLFDKYQCPHCYHLLKNAVQLPICGHWLCQCCADDILESFSPKCPRPDCLEDFREPDEAKTVDTVCYFPDWFVRKEINFLTGACHCCENGCQWKGSPSDLEVHQTNCEFHKHPEKARCPLADLGCQHTGLMTSDDHAYSHLEIIYGSTSAQVATDDIPLESEPSPQEELLQIPRKSALAGVKDDHHLSVGPNNKCVPTYGDFLSPMCALRRYDLGKSMETVEHHEYKLKQLEDKNDLLKNKIAELEEAMRSKRAESADRDFRLSLIENSNHDGNMIWRIPQFSQRMADAQSGRCTSILSLPFYTGRYGYKMCLRLYILGDGIGKNTHMSLFFVIMKGEFDNILKWPFTSKVTFKLINQTGNRDIIDTFQPDPMSSYFQKPKSEMNIVLTCPRFVSHTELKSDRGFVINNVAFLKCLVDCSSIMH